MFPLFFLSDSTLIEVHPSFAGGFLKISLLNQKCPLRIVENVFCPRKVESMPYFKLHFDIDSSNLLAEFLFMEFLFLDFGFDKMDFLELSLICGNNRYSHEAYYMFYSTTPMSFFRISLNTTKTQKIKLSPVDFEGFSLAKIGILAEEFSREDLAPKKLIETVLYPSPVTLQSDEKTKFSFALTSIISLHCYFIDKSDEKGNDGTN